MPFIQFTNISKEYRGCVSCQQVDLEIQSSTIHSIVGENGAGKSTLMKILGGLVIPTTGTLLLRDQPYSPRSALDAFDNKIAFIHQHFVLARQLTAFENILLSSSSNLHPLSKIPKTQIREKTERFLKKFNWSIALDHKVEKISVGEQQRLEILKALLLEPEIFIFDEPTAVLTPQESDDLMNFLLELKREGKTILLVSHKLNEIKKVSDFITVMRHGKIITTRANSSFSVDEMAESMIGRKVQKSLNQHQLPENAYEVFKLPGTKIPIHRSEIFGVAGIEGHGQSELIQQLIQSCQSLNLKYGDITEDRLPLSVFPEVSLIDHLILRHPTFFSEHGFINKSSARLATEALIQKWDVRPGLPDQALSELSGGNQQKFAVGRELFHGPEVLIAAHPSRGVDLGAQEMIHQTLIDFAANKNSVVLISSDLNEVLQLSQRFVILYHHQVYGPFEKNSLTEIQIGRYMTGLSNEV